MKPSAAQPRMTGFAAASGRDAQTDIFGTETDIAELPATIDHRERFPELFNNQKGNR